MVTELADFLAMCTSYSDVHILPSTGYSCNGAPADRGRDEEDQAGARGEDDQCLAELAVDGVVIIGEHGNYPSNEKGQQLFPRRRFFAETAKVFEKCKQSVPVFSDKHLSATWTDAKWVYDKARELFVPFLAGSSIPQAAQLAADEIDAAGGVDGRKIEIISYDNHSSAAESVRAFQRAATEDHVNAVIASYISEVVLALEPWTGRLKTVMVTPGAASDVITQNIAKDYNNLKYTFHGYSTSTSIADATCEAAKDIPPKPNRLVVNASGGAMGDAMKKAYVAVFERQTGSPVTLTRL